MQNRFVPAIFPLFFVAFLSSSALFADYSMLRIRAEGPFGERDYFQSPRLLLDREVITLKHAFLSGRRLDVEATLGRAPRYFGLLEEYLYQAGLPNAFKYIPVVESELRPDAVSPNGAAGLWQIMPSTGRYYGLRIDKVVDERRDLYLSTRAATQYLSDLQAEFCDWMLVLAAYNCGPGKVRKAMRIANSSDYIRLKRHLPAQTQRYVARFLVFVQLGDTCGLLGIDPDVSPAQAATTQAIHLSGQVSLSAIAVLSGVSMAVIHELNPAFQSGELPVRSAGWRVELPQEAVVRYFRQLAEQEGQQWTQKEKPSRGMSGNALQQNVS